MNCRIPNNTPRTETVPQEVTCSVCGTKYYLRVFPLRAICPMGELTDFLEQTDEQTTGLGDVVAKVIDTVTFGFLKKSEGCGCEDRKNWLNQFWSWKARQ